MRKGVSTNTSRQYATGQRHYLNFCARLNLPACPASELSLLRFVASFGDRIRGSTVQNYLSAVRFLHVSNGYPNPLPDCERLKLVVRALKRISGPRREPAPVTLTILRAVCRGINFSEYNDVLLWAMICVGFFGFLRVSEFTTEGAFDPLHDLCREDLSFAADFSLAFLQLKSSKTDPFRLGVRIVMGASTDCVCPILALSLYLNRRSNSCGALFRFANGRAVSRGWFCSNLQRVIRNTGIGGDFTSHSLRIGAASAASAAGLHPNVIQAMGRWSSEAFKIYVRYSDADKGRFSRHLVLAD